MTPDPKREQAIREKAIAWLGRQELQDYFGIEGPDGHTADALIGAFMDGLRTAEKKSCFWSDDGDDCFETSCGSAYIYSEDHPRECDVRFCPHCGGAVEFAQEAEP